VILLTPTLSFREGVVIITLSEGEGEKGGEEILHYGEGEKGGEEILHYGEGEKGGEEIKSFNKPQGRRRQVVLLKT